MGDIHLYGCHQHAVSFVVHVLSCMYPRHAVVVLGTLTSTGTDRPERVRAKLHVRAADEPKQPRLRLGAQTRWRHCGYTSAGKAEKGCVQLGGESCAIALLDASDLSMDTKHAQKKGLNASLEGELQLEQLVLARGAQLHVNPLFIPPTSLAQHAPHLAPPPPPPRPSATPPARSQTCQSRAPPGCSTPPCRGTG